MDIHTAGLSHLCSPLARATPSHLADEDAYYAAFDGWVLPAWLITLIAALHAPRRSHATEPASIREPKLA